MSNVLSTEQPFMGDARVWLGWWPIGAGLVFLYAPLYIYLSQTLWTTEQNGHGPIMLLVVAWLLWRERGALIEGGGKSAPLAGWILLVCGLLLYVLGQSQKIPLLAVTSHIPVLAGVVLLMRGWSTVRRLWFPLFFLLFAIPLPDVLVDITTGALKQQVSVLTENILYAAGYQVARSGVTLMIGQYQLLVADACSGLNSMFSLAALGLLYVYITGRRRWAHVGLLLASIVPAAFVANVIRVMTLVLITYYFGDAAGQGFLHVAAGMLLFFMALVLLVTLDKLLARIFTYRGRAA